MGGMEMLAKMRAQRAAPQGAAAAPTEGARPSGDDGRSNGGAVVQVDPVFSQLTPRLLSGTSSS